MSKSLNTNSRLSKSQLMSVWAELEPNLDPLAVMSPISGGGSSYGGDGIRISGSPEFVAAVLSRFQDMLDCENQLTRLAASHAIVENVKIGDQEKRFGYAGGHVVYIQMHERGSDAIGAEFVAGATDRFIDRRPGLRKSLEQGRIGWYMFLGMSRADAEARVYGKGKGVAA